MPIDRQCECASCGETINLDRDEYLTVPRRPQIPTKSLILARICMDCEDSFDEITETLNKQ